MKIHARIVGGLGNQLFILSEALSYKKELTDEIFIYDFTNNYKIFRFSVFNCTNNFFKIVEPKKSSLSFLILKSRFAYFYRKFFKRNFIFINNIFLDDYYQDILINNLNNSIKIFRKLFNISTIPFDRVVIHIRGTDFINSKYNINLLNYYQSAINIYKSSKYYIVTDDTKFSLEIINKLKINHYEVISTDTLSDFLFIANSNKIISSNSTFSWWAGVLSFGAFLSPPFFVDSFRPCCAENEVVLYDQ